MRRIFLILFSPLIFIFNLGICGYIIFDLFTDFPKEIRESHIHPFKFIAFAVIMLFSSIATSIYCTIGCIKDGNLQDIANFCKDL